MVVFLWDEFDVLVSTFSCIAISSYFHSAVGWRPVHAQPYIKLYEGHAQAKS